MPPANSTKADTGAASLTPVPQSLTTELNRQYTLERYSEALGLAVSAMLESMNWQGMAHWVRKAAKDERKHADKIYKYLRDRGLAIDVDLVPKPPVLPRDLVALFSVLLDSSKEVTVSLKAISKLALSQDDPTTFHFIKWYLKDQVHEEKDLLDVIAQLQVAGSDPSALLHVDHRIGK